MDAGLKTDASASGSEWKLTLTDSSRNFTTGTACKAGDAIYLNYSGAKTGANEYISAIVKTSSGTISYYGRLKNLANEADASRYI